MKELADRIVALGIGSNADDSNVYWKNDIPYRLTADKFTHSWEVAGALEDKCIEKDWSVSTGKTGKYRQPGEDYYCRIESLMGTKSLACCYSDELRIAKVKAFVEALEAA